MNEESYISTGDIEKFIGQRIKAFRAMRGLNQSELGELLGVSFQQIQKYENGSNRISSSNLFRLAEALDISIKDFFPNYQIEQKEIPNENSELMKSFSIIKNNHFKRAIINLTAEIASGENILIPLEGA